MTTFPAFVWQRNVPRSGWHTVRPLTDEARDWLHMLYTDEHPAGATWWDGVTLVVTEDMEPPVTQSQADYLWQTLLNAGFVIADEHGTVDWARHEAVADVIGRVVAALPRPDKAER